MVDRFRVEKKLGEGAFGAVYKVVDSHGADYALKVEDADEKMQLLMMEVFVLTEINQRNGRHFCQIAGKGRFANFYYVVMTIVGQSLQDLRKAARDQKLSMGCAIGVGIQCLEELEDMQNIGHLHRDVKPGRAERNELRKVYVLDFGMYRKFIRDDGTPRREGRLPRHCPLRAHPLAQVDGAESEGRPRDVDVPAGGADEGRAAVVQRPAVGGGRPVQGALPHHQQNRHQGAVRRLSARVRRRHALYRVDRLLRRPQLPADLRPDAPRSGLHASERVPLRLGATGAPLFLVAHSAPS